MLQIIKFFSSAHEFHSARVAEGQSIGCSDVIVQLKDEELGIIKTYSALFITYEFAGRLKSINKDEPSYLDGMFFHAPNNSLILIDKLSLANIEAVLKELLEQGTLAYVFKTIS